MNMRIIYYYILVIKMIELKVLARHYQKTRKSRDMESRSKGSLFLRLGTDKKIQVKGLTVRDTVKATELADSRR